jgi:hypothetical protein
MMKCTSLAPYTLELVWAAQTIGTFHSPFRL